MEKLEHISLLGLHTKWYAFGANLSCLRKIVSQELGQRIHHSKAATSSAQKFSTNECVSSFTKVSVGQDFPECMYSKYGYC
jgi:hypothetical protein